MINAIALDDEPKALQVIENHSTSISFLNLKKVFTDPFKALDYISENSVDLIFLDINMPDISGLEFTSKIRNKDLLIIFTTAYSEYALDSYEVEAVDYLLKPFEFTRFYTAVSKVRHRLNMPNKSRQEFFFVNTGNERHKISYEAIRFIEGNGNYVTYHLEDKKILVRSSIKQALECLPTSDFVQIQRSYIVSLRQITKIQDNHVLIGDKKISIGPKYKKAFQSIIECLS